MLSVKFYVRFSENVCAVMSPAVAQRPAAWRSGGDSQRLGREANFQNACKASHEPTPRLTPNRLLQAVLFYFLPYNCSQYYFYQLIKTI